MTLIGLDWLRFLPMQSFLKNGYKSASGCD
jgi:hypothetical protein